LASTLGAELKDAERKFNEVGKRLAKGGALLFGGGLAAAGPLLAGAVNTLDELGKLDATAKAFGLTTEAATGLFGVMKAAGSDTRDATEGLVTLGQRVTEAMTGAGIVAGEMFKGLNQNAEDYAGLDPAEQFYKLHAALTAVQDPAKRVQLLFNAVGEDTGKNLIGTLSMTTAELRKNAAGFAITADEMATATKANLAYKSATGAISRAWTQVVVGVAPAITFLSEQFEKLVVPVVAWLKENREIVSVGVGVAAAAIGIGAALIGAGGAITFVTAAGAGFFAILGTVKAALAALFTPVGIAIAAATALGVVFFTQTEIGQRWASAIGGYFKETLGTIMTSWGGIRDAIRKGDIGLAWKIVVAGLDVEWKRFLVLFQQGWTGAQGFFEDAWTDTVATLKKTWLGIGDGSLWTGLVRGATTVGITLKNIFFDALKDIRDYFLKTFDAEIRIGMALKDGDFIGAAAMVQREFAANSAAHRKNGGDLRAAVEKADADFQKANAELARDILTPDANGLTGKAKIEAEAAAEKEANRLRREATVAEARAALDAAKGRLAGFNAEAAVQPMAGAPDKFGEKTAQLSKMAGALGGFNLGQFAGRAFGVDNSFPVKQLKAADEANKIAQRALAMLEKIEGKAGALVFGG